jgi:uncharacterized protein (TIGR02246 family)
MSTFRNDAPAQAQADRDAVLALNARFYQALRAMFAGDASGFADVFAHTEDVIYCPAEGGVIRGFDAAAADWARQADASRGGEIEIVDQDVLLEGPLAVVVCTTRVVLQSADGPRELRVRESSVCRRASGQWRMITHHADALDVWATVVGDAE